MDIKPKLRGIVKLSLYFGYKIDISRGYSLKPYQLYNDSKIFKFPLFEDIFNLKHLTLSRISIAKSKIILNISKYSLEKKLR